MLYHMSCLNQSMKSSFQQLLLHGNTGILIVTHVSVISCFLGSCTI